MTPEGAGPFHSHLPLLPQRVILSNQLHWDLPGVSLFLQIRALHLLDIRKV